MGFSSKSAPVLKVVTAAVLSVTALTACKREVSVQAISSSTVETTGGGKEKASEGDYLASPTSGTPTQIFLRDPFTDSAKETLGFNDNIQPFTSRAFEPRLDVTQDNLQSTWLKVTTDGTYATQIANRKDSLEYPVTDPRFAQVNAFYHASRLLDRARFLGYSMNGYGPISVDAHCNQSNNAYFDPTNKKVCLGYAQPANVTSKLWSSLDADVVIHEFNHSINHFLSTSEIMQETPEAGAMDEGLSDYWANVHSNSSIIGYWFGTAILQAQGATPLGTRSGLRDSLRALTYPQSLAQEIHYDGRIWSGALWNIRKALPNSQRAAFDKIVLRQVQSLQLGDSFKDAVVTLRDLAPGAGLTLAQLDPHLTTRGLLREDDVSGVVLSDVTPMLVIDDHLLDDFNYQANGNCNATLDVGERALVLFNLKNMSSNLGHFTATLSKASDTDTIQIVTGGEKAAYNRILASSPHFLAGLQGNASELANMSVNRLYYGRGQALFNASFVIDATNTTAGAHNFNLKLSSRNSRTGGWSTKTLPVSITVGSAAARASCTQSPGARLWP